MRFSHVFVARPRQEAEELAEMLAPLGLQVVVQPAFDFRAVDSAAEQPELVAQLEAQGASRLLIFTSTRAVEFGLPQLPPGLIGRCRIAAIGPATSQALTTAGVHVNVRPPAGFTSEDLLQTLQNDSPGAISPPRSAVILAAPGGRRKMEESLAELGWSVDVLMVYRRENAVLDKQELQKLNEAQSILSIWTSANAMQSLAQRLPSSAWLKLCLGDWLVISDRLIRLARAYGPPEVHLSAGPGNYDLFTAVRGLI
jgi:uroporphyrinogen-III synthase